MARSSKINAKGQLVIPIEIRKHLGLKPGDCVEFIAEGSSTVIRRKQSSESPFLKYVGAFPAFSSIKEINRWVGEMRSETSRPTRHKKK